MIVRTYQRRSRNAARTTFSDCEEESSSQEYLGFSSMGPSSQDSSSWHYSNNGNQEAKQKVKLPSGLCPPTSTLMEAQESGEMMEHVDEANFALDGLKPGQPLRIQRASLVSLLSICTSAQQRRLLRTHGMAKTVLDAIVALSTDDPPTALAAAALFYALASDGQDEQLLDSAVCIKFLLKLLFSSIPEPSEKKASLGRKLLGVTTNSSMSKAPVSGVDRGGVAITVKVQKLLSSMREIHVENGDQDEDRDCFQFQELNSKWLALLTLEKACLSTVALEDTSGSVRRVGGNFKERLRELGGLDAVCDVAVNCFIFLKEFLEECFVDAALKSTKTSRMIESVRVLSKCMKVMENATFLSEQNQKHLLEMKLKCKGLELSFINLVSSAIKTLSELLVKQKSRSSVYGRHSNSTVPENDAHIHTKTMKDSQISSTVKDADEDLKESKKVRSFASAPNDRRGNRRTGKISNNIGNSINTEKTLSGSVSSCNVQGTSARQSVKSVDQRSDCSDDLADPFTFIDEETEPMKVKQINRQKKLKGLRSSDTKVNVKSNGEDGTDCFHGHVDLDIVKDTALMKGKQFNRQKKLKGLQTLDISVNDSLDGEFGSQCCDNAVGLDIVKEQCVDETYAAGKQESEECALLGDCLLAAVKVIMNLTNDNPLGCNQVASCGGLDTMASLIVNHYPLFQSRLFTTSEKKGKKSGSKSMENGSSTFSENEEAMSDQDLDLLVVILGVLVNLVEKDTENRARLAASSVILPRSTVGDFEVRECRRAVIPLLCSIFLTKQGAGEAAGGGGSLAMESNDEVAIKQGQREAENMIVEAYAALLLGFLSKESKNARQAIALCLPGRNLKVLVPVLERFVAFHLSLNMISSETHACVTEVIESCKTSV